jgi:ankyrin repeat protein
VRYLYGLFPDAVKDTECCERLPLHFIDEETPVETVVFLVDRYPDALLLEDDDGNLPIHVGVLYGSLDVLRLLVERCPESMAEGDRDGNCPIHVAVTNAENPRQLDVLRCLAKHPPGSLLQRVQSRGLGDRRHAGHLPIHLAATEKGKGRHQVDVIKVLAEACPGSLGMPGSLPVHQALTSDVMPGFVQLLVRTLPESVPEATRLGLLRSAMWYADVAEAAQRRRRGNDRSQEGSRSLEFLRSNGAALREALPESFRAADATGSLPIHAAVDVAARIPEEHGGSMEIAKSLAELDPDSLLLPNPDGDLPLHIAIIRNCRHNNGTSTDLACFLLMRFPQAAGVMRREGNLAIHDAIQQRMFGLVREIVRRAPETTRIIGAGGESPLHVAVALPLPKSRSCPHIRRDYRYAELDLVKLLVERSPGSLWVRDRNGDLPLHVAIVRCSGSTAAQRGYAVGSLSSIGS